MSAFVHCPEDGFHIKNGCLIYRLKIADMQSVALDVQYRHPMQADRIWAIRGARAEYAGHRSVYFSTRMH